MSRENQNENINKMKHFLILMMLLCPICTLAQDVIVKKDGSTIVCRVIELNDTEIVYKKWSDLNGSNYVMDKTLASAINYENGKKVNISEATNLFKPGNQNDGVQQFNDRALLGLDADFRNLRKKVKTWRNAGLIGGGILVVAGAAILLSDDDSEVLPVGCAVLGCGVVGGAVCLSRSKSYKRQLNWLQTSSLYQQHFKFENGSSLSTNIDMVNDRLVGQRTLGIGLSYNF